MFDLASLKVKLIIVGVVAVAFVTLGLTTKYYYDENLTAQIAKDGLIKSNEDLNHQLDLYRASKEIDNGLISKYQNTINDYLLQSNNVRIDVVSNVKKIIDKYNNKPKDQQDPEQLAMEISTVRIIGLWKTYCLTHPSLKVCEEISQVQNEK